MNHTTRFEKKSKSLRSKAGGEERFPSPLPGPTGWRASPVCAMQEPIPD